MQQNSESRPVPESWRVLCAKWGDRVDTEDGSAVTFVRTDGRVLMLAPADAVRESGWLRFGFRNAHSIDETTIQPASPPYLLAVRVFADEADRDDFRRWLDEEHCRRHVALPGVRWYLGYEEIGAHSFLNLWGLDDPEIVDSEAWRTRRDTPWGRAIAHVLATSDRGTYRFVDRPNA